MKKLLIVVDMINGFITEGALADPVISRIIPGCKEYIEEFLAADQDIIAFCDTHMPECREFSAYPSHCLIGSRESELVDELLPYKEKITIIPKNSTNGFMAAGFEPYRKKLDDYKEIYIVGCCSDICVMQLALSLRTFINENDWQTDIIVDSRACDTFSLPGHDRDEYNKIAFALLANSGVRVLGGRDDE